MVTQILPSPRGRGLASVTSVFVMIAFIYILGIQTGELRIITKALSDWHCCFFVIGESIKCWVCRSDGDPKCADPFDNTSFPIADCRTENAREHLPGLEPTMCRKVRQKGKLSNFHKKPRWIQIHGITVVIWDGVRLEGRCSHHL